jgi:hypothetical protein
MTGLVGRMFREFALTLTIAVVISAVVSLTLTPMMCSRMLRHGSGAGTTRLAQYLNGLVDRVVAGYHRTLLVVLRHEGATLLTTVATLVITIGLYVVVPKGFLPLQDTGLVQAVMEAGPEVSFTEMVKLQDAVADAVRTDADVSGRLPPGEVSAVRAKNLQSAAVAHEQAAIGILGQHHDVAAGQRRRILRIVGERLHVARGRIDRNVRAYAVNGVVVGISPLTIDAELPRRLGQNRSRRELNKRIKASSIERQVLDELTINDSTDSRRSGLNQRCAVHYD